MKSIVIIGMLAIVAMVVAQTEPGAPPPIPTDMSFTTNDAPFVVTNLPVVIKRTQVEVWLTDDLTGEPYMAVMHITPRPISFYKVVIKEEE